VNGTLGTLEDDETGRGAPTKQHRSSPDCPGPGQQVALADDESPRLAKLAINTTANNANRSKLCKQQKSCTLYERKTILRRLCTLSFHNTGSSHVYVLISIIAQVVSKYVAFFQVN